MVLYYMTENKRTVFEEEVRVYELVSCLRLLARRLAKLVCRDCV